MRMEANMEHNGVDAAPLCLILPGLGGSGHRHWQTLWERDMPDARRVEQADWDDPYRDDWVEALHNAVVEPGVPVILVAHSLGCLTVAWWAAAIAQGYGRPVAGALLVAPPDVDRTGAHPLLRRFAPLPLQPLPFPSILVASRDDPYATIDASLKMARIWQSHFVDAGDRGHINADSGLGMWDEGRRLLDQLKAAATRRRIRPIEPYGRLTAPPPVEISSARQAWG